MLSPVMLCADPEKEKAVKKRVTKKKDVFCRSKYFMVGGFIVKYYLKQPFIRRPDALEADVNSRLSAVVGLVFEGL